MTTTLLLALTLTAGAAEPQQAAAPAATQVDARFNNWLGCWRLEDDLTGTGARMCITPDQTGVRLQTIVGVQRGIDELVVADGQPRPITDSACKGTERAEWSADGLRVFRVTDVTCTNERPRTVKSVAFLAPGPAWINVQHISGEAASTSVRVQRYRRANNQNLADGTKAPQPVAAASAARTGSDTRWDIDDVIEASKKMPAEAVQAALSDVRHGFNLTRNTLVALDDAGVAEGVIDLMVALTFPKRFVVDRPGGGGGGGSMGISTGGGWFDPFMSPLAYGSYANCYTPYGYGYRTYYSMCGGYYSAFGYGPGYYNNYYGYPGNGWVIIDNNPGVGTGVPAAAVEGRVVNGRGYTQIRPRDPEPSPMRAGNRGNGTAAGYSGASGGTSGVSSQGYSGGSSGGGSSSSGDSGRTAVARPPGGGS